MLGNAVSRRFRFNNLVIPSIGAADTESVAVAVPSGSVVVGDVGFAVATARMTDGLPGIIPCRATDVDEITLDFANPSAGAIDPADTFDFNVFIFPSTGEVVTV